MMRRLAKLWPVLCVALAGCVTSPALRAQVGARRLDPVTGDHFITVMNDQGALVEMRVEAAHKARGRVDPQGHSVAADSSTAITHRRGSNPFTLSCRFNYDPAVRF